VTPKSDKSGKSEARILEFIKVKKVKKVTPKVKKLTRILEIGDFSWPESEKLEKLDGFHFSPPLFHFSRQLLDFGGDFS